MVNRRRFLDQVVLGLLTAPLAAGAQPADKVESRGWLPAFREKLKHLGWVEGENLRIEYRLVAGKADRLTPVCSH